jgi:hypothetical protein
MEIKRADESGNLGFLAIKRPNVKKFRQGIQV